MLNLTGKTAILSSLFAATFALSGAFSGALPGAYAATTTAHAQTHAKAIHAAIHDSTGKAIGEVVVRQRKDGVFFLIVAHHLTPGVHGVHVHSVGKCEAPGFKSAGGHFALAGEEHGMKNPKGPHLGDLPNMTVGANGTGTLHYLNKLVTLGDGSNSLRKAGGTSLIIHAGPDDQMSNPSGNSGGRIACAVLSE